MQALAHSSFLNQLVQSSQDRILVLIQLFGGNDGLNTLIPVENSTYYNARPTLAIPKPSTLPLTSQLGMHPVMGPLRNLYNGGQMAIIQGVGYADSSLSHFRSSDVWITGSDINTTLTTGWTGRQMELTYPYFDVQPTNYPPAVRIGGLGSLLFAGEEREMGISIANTQLFQRLAREGRYYDENSLPSTPYGEEMRFVRRVANDTFRYGAAIQDASSEGRNDVSYPGGGNYLANSLATVARLIKGNLGSHVYHVGLGGFDTHGSQGASNGTHATLLRYLSDAVVAFLNDIRSAQRGKDVLVLSFSEFGRRVEQNGSNGTDHGTAAPLFLFGEGVNGGMYGQAPSLTDLDGNGNLKYHVDFRGIYSTVLQHWFGFSLDASTMVLGDPFNPMGFVRDPSGVLVTNRQQPEVPESFALHQNYPNPFNPSTTIPFELHEGGEVQLEVFDAAGRKIRTLESGIKPAGSYTALFDGSGLASGMYHYRLHTPKGVTSRAMSLVR